MLTFDFLLETDLLLEVVLVDFEDGQRSLVANAPRRSIHGVRAVTHVGPLLEEPTFQITGLVVVLKGSAQLFVLFDYNAGPVRARFLIHRLRQALDSVIKFWVLRSCHLKLSKIRHLRERLKSPKGPYTTPLSFLTANDLIRSVSINERLFANEGQRRGLGPLGLLIRSLRMVVASTKS